MKNLALASIVFGALVSVASSQSIFLNPGESYVFSFDASSLPEPTASQFGNTLFGSFGLVANGGGEHSSCLWQVEMFENSVTEAPIFSYVQDRSGDCSLQPLIGGAWQDLQGVVRVTAGSSTLVSPMEVEITVPSPNGFLYYNAQIQAVPEPSILALLVIAGVGGVFCYVRRRATQNLPAM
jgi:hypothetical protein